MIALLGPIVFIAAFAVLIWFITRPVNNFTVEERKVLSEEDQTRQREKAEKWVAENLPRANKPKKVRQGQAHPTAMIGTPAPTSETSSQPPSIH